MTTTLGASLARPSDSGYNLAAILTRWIQRNEDKRQRRRLLDLPDYLLEDIGVSRDDLRRR